MRSGFFKNHVYAIFTALIIGCIYFLPNIIIILFRAETTPLNLEEVFSYGVKVREVFDGHFVDGDPYLWEYKNIFTTWDYYPLALIVGLFYKLMRLTDVSTFFVWFDFLGPATSFLILYILFLQITGHRWWSIFSSFMTTSFTNILVYKFFFRPLLYQSEPLRNIIYTLEQGFNVDFSRLFVPGFTMIFLSLFLLGLYRALKDDILFRRRIIFAGAVFGFLFYVYFYYWVFATIVLGIIGFLGLFLKRSLSVKVAYMSIIGGLISIPHWLRYLSLIKSPFFHEYVARIGIEYSRRFRWDSLDYIVLVFALITFIWLFRKQLGTNLTVYLTSLLLTTTIVINLQMVVGFNPQPDHWGSRVNAYIFIIGAMSAFFFIIIVPAVKFFKNQKMFHALVAISMGLLIITGISVKIKNAADSSYQYGISDDMKAAFAWINKNTPVDSVFVTPSYRSRIIIPFFTHGNVYLPMACLSLAGDSEIIERYISVYQLFGIPRELFVASLNRIRNSVKGKYANPLYAEEFESVFSMFCAKFNARYEENNRTAKDLLIPKEFVSALISRYDHKEIDGFSDLPYRADYIFWGPGERLISRLNPYISNNLSLVYSNKNIAIFYIEHLLH